jgi:hypothetical protein
MVLWIHTCNSNLFCGSSNNALPVGKRSAFCGMDVIHVKKLESVQQPRNKGGLGLMPITIKARALPVKWFVRMLNLDESLWCVLACSLLFFYLATAGRTHSNMLAGNVSGWQLKELPTF